MGRDGGTDRVKRWKLNSVRKGEKGTMGCMQENKKSETMLTNQQPGLWIIAVQNCCKLMWIILALESGPSDRHGWL